MNKRYLLFRFVPTMRCNYRCNYCFVPNEEKSGGDTIFDLHPPAEWVSAMGKWTDYEVEFYCWGGEPFLLNGTYEIVKGWTNYSHVIPGSRLDTNLAFTDKIIDQCRSNKIKLNCSWHTQYDSLEKIFEKIKKLKKADMVGMLNFVASQQNMKVLKYEYHYQIDELIKKFDDIGVFVNIAGDFTLLEKLKGEEYQEYRRLILRYQCEEDWRQLRCEKTSCLCRANQHFFTVHPNGDLSPCLSNEVCGNFFKGTLQTPENQICQQSCPSIVAYPFRTDNSFPHRNHLVRYVERNAEYRESIVNSKDWKFYYHTLREESENVSPLLGQKENINLEAPAAQTIGKPLSKAGTDQPKISIVLPTHNHLKFLPQSIQSIIDQTYQDFELIIVNDGSTDGTETFLEQFNDARIKIIHQENLGLPSALNTGFNNARGELLTWVSADNFCAPIFLEALAAALMAFPNAGIAYAAFAWIDEEGKISAIHRNQDFSFQSLLCCNPGIAAFMYRRECHLKVGNYDQSLEGAEDWDMWLRIVELFQTVYVPEILYYYRLHRDSMTTSMPERIKESSRQTFLKALRRKGGVLRPRDIYAALRTSDRLKQGINGEAYFDLGTRLLHSPFAPTEIAIKLLEQSVTLDSNKHKHMALSNLAVAYCKSGNLDKAKTIIHSLSDTVHPIIGKVAELIESTTESNFKKLFENPPLFRLEEGKSQLLGLEKKQKKSFSFSIHSVLKAENNYFGQNNHRAVQNLPDRLPENRSADCARALTGESMTGGFSFCIITNGKRPDKLQQELDSIRGLKIPEYEILIAGELSPTMPVEGFTYHAMVAAARNGKLGAMRNYLCDKARYQNLIVADDDMVFKENFFKGLSECCSDYDVLALRILNPDGTRYWDWAICGGPEGHRLLEYGNNNQDIYITGGLCVIRSEVARSVRWNDQLGLYQNEDIDFSRRVREAGFSIKFCPQAEVTHDDNRYTQVGDIVMRLEEFLEDGVTLYGFYQKEPHNHRWMSPNGTIAVSPSAIGNGGSLSFQLTCSEGRHYGSFPFDLIFSTASKRLGTLRFDSKIQTHKLVLTLPTSGSDTLIHLKSSSDFVPKMAGINDDMRRLSVMFSNFKLTTTVGANY